MRPGPGAGVNMDLSACVQGCCRIQALQQSPLLSSAPHSRAERRNQADGKAECRRTNRPSASTRLGRGRGALRCAEERQSTAASDLHSRSPLSPKVGRDKEAKMNASSSSNAGAGIAGSLGNSGAGAGGSKASGRSFFERERERLVAEISDVSISDSSACQFYLCAQRGVVRVLTSYHLALLIRHASSAATRGSRSSCPTRTR